MEKKSFTKPQKQRSKIKDKSYEERREREAERFKHATDPNIWLCFCFRTKEDKAEFVSRFNLEEAFRKTAAEYDVDGDYIKDDNLRELLSTVKPEKKIKSFGGRIQTSQLGYDPLSSLKMTDSLEQDAYDELMMVYDVLKNAKPVKNPKCDMEAGNYFVAVFDSESAVDRFLDDFNLRKFGIVYIEASQWLKTLR